MYEKLSLDAQVRHVTVQYLTDSNHSSSKDEQENRAKQQKVLLSVLLIKNEDIGKGICISFIRVYVP